MPASDPPPVLPLRLVAADCVPGEEQSGTELQAEPSRESASPAEVAGPGATTDSAESIQFDKSANPPESLLEGKASPSAQCKTESMPPQDLLSGGAGVPPASAAGKMAAPPGCSPGADSAQTNAAPASASFVSAEQRPRSNFTPTTFGAYELVWEICRDALSTTYAAKREGIEKLLALRIFNVKLTDSSLVRTIQKGASKTAELTHQNHVTIYDHGVGDGGAPYVVTDWIEGESLVETFQTTKRLDIARFLSIFGQVCDALIEAHSRQLVHGNLSPHKIILATNDYESDNVKLIDFGMPPDPVQNAFYLSPEQCLDRSKVDGRTDIYSLGCIMYEALVGNPPFVGHKISQAALNYLHELANQYSPDSPEHNAIKLLDCIIIKCIQKNPSKRFRNVRELTGALQLVSDCVCGGNTRKLPPKAEKLLLFRFLDLFDKKITVALIALFLFVGVQAKLVAEVQLQKAINQAQLSRMRDPYIFMPLRGSIKSSFMPSDAVGDWREALRIAELANKPPSLKAELHWELADEYQKQSMDTKSDAARLALANEAAAQYKEALKYYSRGRSYQSYAMLLLGNIANLSTFCDIDEQEKQRESVSSAAGKLFKQKKFLEADAACSKFLRANPFDPQVSPLASRACNEAGMLMPPAKGIRYFERSYCLAQLPFGYPEYALQNLNLCINQLGYEPTSETHIFLAGEALKRGDIDAAYGELQAGGSTDTSDLSNSISDYRCTVSLPMSMTQSASLRDSAIQALTELLGMQEKAFGELNKTLAPTLIQLAELYAADGQTDKAVAAYQRFFSVAPDPQGYENDALALADLLVKSKHPDQARKFLEKLLRNPDGSSKTNGALFVGLLKTYAAGHMTEKLNAALSDTIGDIKPTKLGSLNPDDETQ